MSEIHGEQPEDKKEEPVIKPEELESLRFNPEKPTEIQQRFLEVMKTEDIREDELKRLRAQLMKKYQDLSEEEIDMIIQSEKIQDNLEDIVKIRNNYLVL